jgi:hypothetical protein
MNNVFSVEETFNNQNDRVYPRSSKEAHELVPKKKRGKYAVCWGVSYNGVTSLYFCEKGIKIAGHFNKCSGAPKQNYVPK